MMLWHELFPNLAVVAIATSFWTLGHRHALKLGTTGCSLAFSIVMSLGILGTMAIPFQFMPAVVLDARYTFLAVAPISAVR